MPSTIEAPPLPKPVGPAAYKADETVVLLVVHNGGIDDEMVKTAVETLEGDAGVALFIVPAKQIYRYASITLGVEVSRVPALVVMRPRKPQRGARRRRASPTASRPRRTSSRRCATPTTTARSPTYHPD